MQFDKSNIETLLSLKSNGKDVNQQLLTIQGSTLTSNTYGILWNNAFEEALAYFLPESLFTLFDMDCLYIKKSKDEWLSVQFLIFGEEQHIYLDFNTMKFVHKSMNEWYVMPVEINQQKQFVVTKNPDEFEMNDGIKCYPTILESLHQLDSQLINGEELEFIIPNYLEKKLNERNMTKLELADLINIKYKTLISKFKINSITAEELIRIAIALDLDLNELMMFYLKHESKLKQPLTKEIYHIAGLIQLGFTEGVVPSWELEIPKLEMYPLTDNERLLISKDLEKGYSSGYLPGEPARKWRLAIR